MILTPFVLSALQSFNVNNGSLSRTHLEMIVFGFSKFTFRSGIILFGQVNFIVQIDRILFGQANLSFRVSEINTSLIVTHVSSVECFTNPKDLSQFPKLLSRF